jgi:hypothetical protein
MTKLHHRGVSAKGRNTRTKSFAGIPRVVLDHPDFIKLPPCAKVLLLELARQYRGHNNGDLQAAWSLMKLRGFGSNATLVKARKALLAAQLIVCTREGRFLNPGGVCGLYAITWLPVDECDGKHDYRPTTTPIRKF